jgi:hypothetical protein
MLDVRLSEAIRERTPSPLVPIKDGVPCCLVLLWRGGLRIQEALALGQRDLVPRRGSLLVR